MGGFNPLSQLFQSVLIDPNLMGRLSTFFTPNIQSTGNVEADIAAFQEAHPPNAVQRWMATPLSQILGIPVQSPRVPGSYDYTQLTGKPSPAQPIADWMTEVADKQLATPGMMAMALPISKKPVDIQRPPSVQRILGDINANATRPTQSAAGNLRLADAGSRGGSPEVAAEEFQQVGQLRANQHPSQSIVTISDAKDWLSQRNLLPQGLKHSPSEAIDALRSNPEFRSLNIFDRTRLAAQLERRNEPNIYAPEMGVQNVNSKGVGSTVLQDDTIRGCDQNCFGCYANKLTGQAQIEHEVPVRTELKGKLNDQDLMRIGTVGEPAKDWNWTNEQIGKVVERSQKSGANVTPEKNTYAITKLLNLDGYNSAAVPNLEVSIDPLYPAHMRQSMANALRLKNQFPDANVVLRIRSIQSLNPDLMASQKAAVDFAKRFEFPVLETRMRFNRNDAFDILELDPSKYHKVGNQWKVKEPILKGQVKDWHMCDRLGTGTCATCQTCQNLMVNRRGQNISQVNAALEREGISGASFRGFPRSLDVRGTEPPDQRLIGLSDVVNK